MWSSVTFCHSDTGILISSISLSLFPVIFSLYFSHIGHFRLNLKGNNDFRDSGFCLNDECWRSYEQKVLGVIDQALKGRTKLIRVVWRNIPSDCNFENVWY